VGPGRSLSRTRNLYTIGTSYGATTTPADSIGAAAEADVVAGSRLAAWGVVAVKSPEQESAVECIKDIDRRQDEVLRQLELLEQRIATLLSEYAESAVNVKRAA
jgi:hypothetical protein